MSATKVGKNFWAGTATNSVVQIVDPAVNTQGVIIRTLSFTLGPDTAVSQATLYADTVAPTAWNDTTKRPISVFRLGVNVAESEIIPYQIEIPAGLGIWFATLRTPGMQITYDFIQT